MTGFKSVDYAGKQVRNAEVLLVVEIHGPGRNFWNEIGRLAALVAIFGRVAHGTDFCVGKIYIFGRAAFGNRGMALNARQSYGFEVH